MSGAFSRNVLKKFPELAPLIGIMGGAVVMASSFVTYAVVTKPDVRVVKSSELAPFERVKPTESRKLVTLNKDMYRENSELEKLRKEIGSYKA